ncbi:hypothetical protein [Kordiimonas marina]|uniref:hypothetical protein n=1 Tax=Kordiimonas marina TaxID=2872312 RepID=UPI001FF2B457|nr:hypothetical protein [Kordiimonas marina]MCJ9430741.1 hypothetical protein [Kordiimonas marina]
MIKTRAREQLVLAVYPSRIGFGYALYKGSTLQEWGIKWAAKDKNKVCVRKFKQLIELSRPDALVLEYIPDEIAERRPRTAELNNALGQIARMNQMKLYRYSRAEIRDAFACHGARTKHAIAKHIGDTTPELQSLVPPPRRLWDPEPDAMTYFSATSLALTYFHFANPER